MGIYLWKLLDGEHSLGDLVQSLRRDVEDVPEEAAGQIEEFIADLTRRGLAGYKVISDT